MRIQGAGSNPLFALLWASKVVTDNACDNVEDVADLTKKLGSKVPVATLDRPDEDCYWR